MNTPFMVTASRLPERTDVFDADRLLRQLGIDSPYRHASVFLVSSDIPNNVNLHVASLERMMEYCAEDNYDALPDADHFIAFFVELNTTVWLESYRPEINFYTRELEKYSLLPVFSSETILNWDDPERFFNDDYTREEFLSALPEHARRVMPPRGKDPHATLLAQLRESHDRYVQQRREYAGFRMYDPDGATWGIVVTTKDDDDAGICPVQRIYDDELQCCQSTDNGAILGYIGCQFDLDNVPEQTVVDTVTALLDNLSAAWALVGVIQHLGGK